MARWTGRAAVKKRGPRVQLRRIGDIPVNLLPALDGRWGDLPERLSVHELGVVAHMVNGYDIASDHLGCEVFDLARQRQERFREKRSWDGSAVELLAVFFAVVRGWRGLYDYPENSDDYHAEAQSLYEAVRRRLLEHPDEVELVPAEAEPPTTAGSTDK